MMLSEVRAFQLERRASTEDPKEDSCFITSICNRKIKRFPYFEIHQVTFFYLDPRKDEYSGYHMNFRQTYNLAHAFMGHEPNLVYHVC